VALLLEYFCGVQLDNRSATSLLNQGFMHSPVISDLRFFLGKGFAVRVLGLFCFVFFFVAFGLGGKKVPSIFGIEIHT
jgi:hypothetical protein